MVIIDQFLLKRKLRSKCKNCLQVLAMSIICIIVYFLVVVMSTGGYMSNVPSSNLRDLEEQSDMFQQFFYSLNPIDETDWVKGNNFMRVLMVVKSPIIVALRIFIPVVDYELDDCGWSKLLNCIQIVLSPTFILYCVSKSMNCYYL